MVATLVAVTKEAEQALGGARELPLPKFPVRFGRAHRSKHSRLAPSSLANDVYLQEREGSSSLHISGNHFTIEQYHDQFFLVDRGSTCGTIVAGTRIGGRRIGGRTELRDGDEVIVGTRQSRYIFRFTIGNSAGR